MLAPFGDCLALLGVPWVGGLKGKKPYAAHKFFCFYSLSLESFSPPFGDCLALLAPLGDCLALLAPLWGLPRFARRSLGGGLKRKNANCLWQALKMQNPHLSKLMRVFFFSLCPSDFGFFPFAVRGGFEPPEPFRVRQFSKLLVSATHPPHQDAG